MSFSAFQWLAPKPESSSHPHQDNEKVEWFRCTPFILIHLAAITTIFLFPVTWPCIALAVLSYSVRMFAITAFYHRYFSHRAFQTSRLVQWLGAFAACSAGQRGPLWWAAHHRMHHRHSDTDEDMHSPHRKTFLQSHLFWFMTDYALPTYLKEIPDWLKFPELRFLNRFDWVPVVFLASACYLAGETTWAATHFSATGWQWLTWGFLVPTVLLYHATFSVNSIAHMFGKKRFQTNDESRNNPWLAIITFGEGWHNNHHFFPSSVKQGFRKREIDLTYWILWTMSRVGLVRKLKPVPKWVQEKAQY
ncbi:MAG: acyl-CoA desaturase [Opitutae bacterium]|nr:acyl-CoA desaturase [Opitutae bacterium]|tara:strand:- start:2006 stop:2920 length:915 start_codon:yes stop_codon:yes gene_type:complete